MNGNGENQVLQFQSEARCTSCKDYDLKCWSGINDKTCISCAAAGHPCFFSRTVMCSGPRELLLLFSDLKISLSDYEAMSSDSFGYRQETIVQPAQGSMLNTWNVPSQSENSIGGHGQTLDCFSYSDFLPYDETLGESELSVDPIKPITAGVSQSLGAESSAVLGKGACGTDQSLEIKASKSGLFMELLLNNIRVI